MASSSESPATNHKFHFHIFDVTPQVFHTTALSFAFVNLKPLLPGHVLVSPRRRVVRFTQLTDAEAADLFVTAKRVARTLERVYSATGLTVPLQDGFDAGQSCPTSTSTYFRDTLPIWTTRADRMLSTTVWKVMMGILVSSWLLRRGNDPASRRWTRMRCCQGATRKWRPRRMF